MPNKKSPPSELEKLTRAFKGIFIILLAITIVISTNVFLFSKLENDSQSITGDQVVNYTATMVALHNTPTDCWIIVDGVAYDITRYIDKGTHTGGRSSLEAACGKDVSTGFNNSHSDRARQELIPYRLGSIQ